ncbi:DUF6417 family protein [Streptomyces griseofuscus]|uniref:DUF6417 family protein n=1 Tax=Streptomyces griseofuscus TaxID=146922 RepID=UPI0033DCD950
MGDTMSRVELLEMLRDVGQARGQAWVLFDDVSAGQQQAAEAAARRGLVEVADQEALVELSVHEGRTVEWAARLTPEAHDALVYARTTAVPTPWAEPAEHERLVELRPSQMDALRRYLSLTQQLRVPPAAGLAERVRTAYSDRAKSRWITCLTEEQATSAAYAFFLHSVHGSVAEANRFAREYGTVYRVDTSTGRLRPARLR